MNEFENHFNYYMRDIRVISIEAVRYERYLNLAESSHFGFMKETDFLNLNE